ncbi:MAG TPA: hypothetical protein VJ142_03300 [Candidatus Nanoarchaeia archaeon]|nr:hypothetical protein [Candidatus Nanoarchaeia archaeon]
MNDYKPKPGDIAFYLEGENLVLGVEILEVLLDKEKEAYKLKINEVLREGESRFTRNIQPDETFVCSRERGSFSRSGLWELVFDKPRFL